MARQEELLRVEGLTVSFPAEAGRRTVVDNVSFTVGDGEVVGLVGESGSGKTVSATAVLGLIRPPGRVEAGHVWFRGQDLLQQPEDRLQAVRGRNISMIFQSPRSHLNPLMKVGDQIARILEIHQGLRGSAARAEVMQLLRLSGLSDPEVRAQSYPHQLSGGMCQRVMIAMALACRPALLIADEPTTGLDVTIEAQIFDLVRELQERMGMAMLLITHDLGVVADVCHRVVVMHAGHVVEEGDVQSIFGRHRHPYTRHLFQSVLRIDGGPGPAVPPLPGAALPGVDYRIAGCRYANKCPLVLPRCWDERPRTHAVAPGHQVMCHLMEEDVHGAAPAG